MGKESLSNKPGGGGEDTGFKREIGVFGGVSIIGGIMIGSGIFYIGSIVLQRTHMSLGWALLCWIIGGVISLLGGICFAELGASDPRTGGLTVYLTTAYHPILGFVGGFCPWLLSNPGSIAAVAVALPTALLPYFHMSDMQIKIFAIILIVGLTFFNCFEVKFGSTLQNIFMIAKVLPLIIILVGAMIFGKQTPDLSLVSTATESMSIGGILGMVGFAVVATLWAYEGWINLNLVAEEIKNPQKNLPRAIILGIGGITLLYALFNFAIYRMIPYDEIVSRINANDLYLGTAVAKKLMGEFGGTFVTIAMVLAMFGSLNGMVLSFPRTYYAMSVEGHFFKSQGVLHPKYGTPVAALFWQAVISIVLVMMRSLSQLTSMVVFLGMVFNMLTILGVIRYRKKFPDLKRPYKVRGGIVTVWIVAILFALLAINNFIEDPITAMTGVIAAGIGVAFYFYFDRQKKKEEGINEKNTI